MTIASPRAARNVAPAVRAEEVPRDYNFAADILKRNLDAGRGAKAAFILKYGKLVTLRQLIAPSFYFALLGLLLLGLFWSPALIPLGGLLLLYAGATFGCALRETLPRGETDIVLHMTWVCMAMHFGYALGYFKRLVVRDKPGTFWGG